MQQTVQQVSSNAALRAFNMNFVMAANNLPKVKADAVSAVSATPPVSTPVAAATNTTGTELKKAGAFTAFFPEQRNYRVVVVSTNGFDSDYVVQREGADGIYRSLLGPDGLERVGSTGLDAVFGDEVFVLRHWWDGLPDVGDVFTFQTDPEATIVPMPVLFGPNADHPDKADAFTINMVNAIISGDTVIFGDRRGPVIPFIRPLAEASQELDIFREYAMFAYEQAGYAKGKMAIVNQTSYHWLLGGIHCSTNFIREIPTEFWWE